LYVYIATNPGKFAEFTESVNGWIPMSIATTILEASIEIVLKSTDKLMYKVTGIKIAVIGQTIVG